MLQLLSPSDAAFVIYCSIKKKNWQLAFLPVSRQEVYEDKKELNQLLMYQLFIENAIKAGELPAIQQSKGKAADKKLHEKLDIPSEFREALTQTDYWITLEDLFAFAARQESSSPQKR